LDLPQLESLGDLSGKAVLVRTDFNVPLEDGRITDDLRIRAALPTLQFLQEAGARVTACSHLGRPKGQPDPHWSMEPVRARLAELAPGVELLENLRFDPGEEAGDPAFVERLVAGQDVYVNDAFGAAHRAHASIVGPPRTLPSAAGRLLAEEVEVLSRLREQPARPFVGILGGAKVSDKLGVISALLDVVDTLLIGGAMCFTFMAAQGKAVGDSLVEPDQVEAALQLWSSGKLLLPSDVVALGPGGSSQRTFGTRTDLPEGWRGLDVGPGTAAEFTDVIDGARTVFWNGPMGRPLRCRHPGGGRGGGPLPGLHRRGRGRQRRRPGPLRAGRRGRPRLHRRRCVARAARARRPPRPRGPARSTECLTPGSPSSRATGRCT
jgi:phosphoglycerate kinase